MILRLLHKWHRRLGVAAALFVLMLAVTGILLNHTERLRLDSIYVSSNVILDWYDIRPDASPVSFAAGGNRLTRIGDRLYFNASELEERSKRLNGAVLHGGMIVVALAKEILILTPAGDVVEKLSGVEGVPAGLQGIGVTAADEVAVRGAHGDYLADLDTLQWREAVDTPVEWSVPSPVPRDLYDDLLQQYRGRGLTMERLLLDLHSGRIVGTAGVFIVDAAALLFVVLAMTGFWMWLVRKM